MRPNTRLGRTRYRGSEPSPPLIPYLLSDVGSNFFPIAGSVISSATPSRITASAAFCVPTMQFVLFAKFRAFWVLLPVPNQNAPSNHRPQMIMAWGLPSERTVTIQYSRDSVRVFTAQSQGNIPLLLLLMP